MALARKHILKIDPYEAGKPIEEIKRQMGLKEVIKLASNENPLGPSPKAIEAIKKNLSTLNRYPDSNGFYLKRKIAKCLNLEPSNIVLGNGSDELIDIIIKAFVEEDEQIITADFTFLEYRIISHVKNRTVITVPLKYFKYDLEAIRKRIDKKTKVVFIANPNNPTGTYVTRREIGEFLSGLPEDVLLVLDEAYGTFIDVNDFPSSLQLIRNNNVVVLRTFSKAYGLAGIRVGFAAAKPELAACMEIARQPFNVNSLAQAAAIAALDDKKFLKKTRQVVLEGKKYLYDALAGMGIAFVPSVSNFILIDAGRDGSVVFKEMLKFGVIVRDMKQYGLKNYIRVTIGTKKENERFIKVLKKIS
ncbi:MAG: histidinol-phosphate transaminase [Candidatus Omnitrophica bacterium]|jgi:histidinol-phosphate aminotransferase|nr:histidinol-phosphate transaminase [Candidatus Omnitrophota bacterium]